MNLTTTLINLIQSYQWRRQQPQSLLALPEDQGQFVDIHRYYRTGGVNWCTLKNNTCMVMICAQVGDTEDECRAEFMNDAAANNIPQYSYWIPDPMLDLYASAEKYLALPGVLEHGINVDVEKARSSSRLIRWNELAPILEWMEDQSYKRPSIYINPANIRALGTPAGLGNYQLHIAQYLYQPYTTNKFTDWVTFYKYWWGKLPPGVPAQLRDAVVAWQITDKGHASYAANRITRHPTYTFGVTQVDLNVTIYPKQTAVQILCG